MVVWESIQHCFLPLGGIHDHKTNLLTYLPIWSVFRCVGASRCCTCPCPSPWQATLWVPKSWLLLKYSQEMLNIKIMFYWNPWDLQNFLICWTLSKSNALLETLFPGWYAGKQTELLLYHPLSWIDKGKSCFLNPLWGGKRSVKATSVTFGGGEHTIFICDTIAN